MYCKVLCQNTASTDNRYRSLVYELLALMNSGVVVFSQKYNRIIYICFIMLSHVSSDGSIALR